MREVGGEGWTREDGQGEKWTRGKWWMGRLKIRQEGKVLRWRVDGKVVEGGRGRWSGQWEVGSIERRYIVPLTAPLGLKE